LESVFCQDITCFDSKAKKSFDASTCSLEGIRSQGAGVLAWFTLFV